MTDLHPASSIFPSLPRPFICFPTRTALLHTCQIEQRRPFTILSPLHAGASLGIDWWCEFIRGCTRPSILDCGSNAALALAALDEGIEGVICRDFRPSLPAGLQERLATYRPPEIQTNIQTEARNDLFRPV